MDMGSMSSSDASTNSSSNTSTSSGSVMTTSFHTGRGDALWFSSWTPTSPVAYAFTLLFLVALAMGSRALAAYMALKERDVAVRNARLAAAMHVSPTHSQEVKDGVTVKARSVSSLSTLTPPLDSTCHPWRITVDGPRGVLHLLYSGIGYLLMLAVMTLNLGYFFAVLVGLGVGEVAFGRFAFPGVSAPRRPS